ncbi:glutamate racemase [Propionivibrio sp.]|uniref:glutamate racemase n=1 Tax=Propionivibrio sp. TaxID=2212460 RepID=UPI0039E6D8C0
MIGVFDSGIGGLSVLAAVARVLPRSDFIYFADTAHVPYGDKSDAYIRARVLRIGRYLAERDCRQIVVACNTATAAAVAALRESLPRIGVVGVEPGIKPAAAASRSGRIAVLATESTARSERLARLIRQYAGPVRVDILPCPGWATKVETLKLEDPDFADAAQRLLEPVLAAGADHVVLGCTHYAFLAPVLEPIVAGRAVLIDVADAVARQCRRIAGELGEDTGETAGGAASGRLELTATAHPERLHRALAVLGPESLAARLSGPAVLAAV